MADAIITELWKIKDEIAREHGYDIDALLAYLQARSQEARRANVDLHSRKKAAKRRIDDDKPSGA